MIERLRRRGLRRWVIPMGGATSIAILIVVATPHVVWPLRVALAVVAFLYLGGQSAAYLWHDDSDPPGGPSNRRSSFIIATIGKKDSAVQTEPRAVQAEEASHFDRVLTAITGPPRWRNTRAGAAIDLDEP